MPPLPTVVATGTGRNSYPENRVSALESKIPQADPTCRRPRPRLERLERLAALAFAALAGYSISLPLLPAVSVKCAFASSSNFVVST